MIYTETEVRDAIETEAKTWIGTPYRDRGQVKGRHGGVDCCTLLIGVFSEAGAFPWFVPPFYTPQEPLHKFTSRYLGALLRYARPLDEGEAWLPGDVMMFKIAMQASAGHAAIYLGGESLIHAEWRRQVCLTTTRRSLFRTLVGVYRFRG